MKGYYRNKTINTLDKSTLDQGLKEQGFPLPFPWQVFSSLEVADALGRSLQSMHNMRMRRTGPLSEPFDDYRGNRLHYRYDNLYSWLTDEPAWKYHQTWISQTYPSLPSETQEECKASSELLIRTRTCQQPKWKRKAKAGLVATFGGA